MFLNINYMFVEKGAKEIRKKKKTEWVNESIKIKKRTTKGGINEGWRKFGSGGFFF